MFVHFWTNLFERNFLLKRGTGGSSGIKGLEIGGN